MKVNKKFLWEVIFNFSLLVGGIFYICMISFDTEKELIEGLQKTTSNKTRRSREIDITILHFFGKKGYYIFIITGLFLVLKYRFLPSLRKFLGKKVEEEEEGKKSEE